MYACENHPSIREIRAPAFPHWSCFHPTLCDGLVSCLTWSFNLYVTWQFKPVVNLAFDTSMSPSQVCYAWILPNELTTCIRSEFISKRTAQWLYTALAANIARNEGDLWLDHSKIQKATVSRVREIVNEWILCIWYTRTRNMLSSVRVVYISQVSSRVSSLHFKVCAKRCPKSACSCSGQWPLTVTPSSLYTEIV